MLDFHGFSDTVHGQGQVPPEDSVSSCQDMNCIFGLLSLLTGRTLHSWTQWLIFTLLALKDMVPLT